MNYYKIKTTPWPHQLAALERSWNKKEFALFMEQRTGKTKVVLDTASTLHHKGRIKTLVVVAPNGVHRDWVEKQLPEHCAAIYNAAYWGSKQSLRKGCARLVATPLPMQLQVLAINYEALLSAECRALLATALKKDSLLVLDESHRVKNPRAATTKHLLKLAELAKYRRILTGTPYGGSPLDLYAQFRMLDWQILGHKTQYTFLSQYAELLKPGNHIYEKVRQRMRRGTPHIVATDANGKQQWKNVAEIERRIQPHSYRVTRDECKALPPKMYFTLDYEMSAEQRLLYKQVMKSIDPTMPHVARLNAASTVQQIMSSIVPAVYKDQDVAFTSNPRLDRLQEFLLDCAGQIIVWCQYVAEVHQICGLLEATSITSYAQLTGATPADERQQLKADFASGALRIIVGHQRVGGVGFDLSAADTVIYYSHSFSLIDRLQSEDRAQHMDKARSVGYYDMRCAESIDGVILSAVRGKHDISEALLKSLSGK